MLTNQRIFRARFLLEALTLLVGLGVTCAHDAGAANSLKRVSASNSVESQVGHGTINIAFANGNGFVVLTDSMETRDSIQLQDPAQKLFKLDDRTVCAIAGFLEADAPATEMATQTAAIIREYSRQLAAGPALSIETELRQLSFLFEVRLSGLADLRQAWGRTDTLPNYYFDLTIAGYDIDGSPKIGKVSVRAELVDGRFNSVAQSPEIKLVKDELVHQTAGMPGLAECLLRYPEREPEDPVLVEYANAFQKDRGNSLTIRQMTDLAIDLAARTAKREAQVGGPNQIAILSEGRVVSVDQPKFPDTQTKSTPFGLMRRVGFSGEGIFRRSGAVICTDCTFEEMHFALDDSYFVATTFTNAVLTYDGGPMYFDRNNRVQNCLLILGPNVEFPKLLVRDLVVNFPWSKVVKASATKPQTSSAGGPSVRPQELTQPKLHLVIDEIAVGESDVGGKPTGAVMIIANLSNDGAPSIADGWSLKVTLTDGRTLTRGTTYLDPSGILKSEHNSVGGSWKLSQADALYVKAAAKPIQSGDKVRGVLVFTYDEFTSAEMKMKGTKFNLSCVDVKNQPVEFEYTFTEESEPHEYYPGLSPIPN